MPPTLTARPPGGTRPTAAGKRPARPAAWTALLAFAISIVLWIFPGPTAAAVEGWSLTNATKVILNSLLDAGYDAASRPGFGSGAPTPVYAQLQIISLYEVDPLSSTFTVDVELTLRWNDPRLVFNYDDYPVPEGSDLRLIGYTELGSGIGPTHIIWTPDVYWENEVDPVILNQVIKLAPGTGDLTWTRHYLVQLTSVFSFQSFPFDLQDLRLMLTPYSYNSLQMSLYWSEPPIAPEPASFNHATFDYRSYKVARELFISREGQPTYDRLIIDVAVTRRSDGYIIKANLPLILLVALSAVSYWLSVEAVPERLGLVVTLVLTVVSFYSTVTAGLPAVNYPTTMDLYVFACFFVTFMALVEVAAVHHLVVRRNDVVMATELDYYCRRVVLPVWAIFNLILIQNGGQALGICIGVAIFVIIIWNAWIFYYRVRKRKQRAFEATADGDERLERKAYKRELGKLVRWTDKLYKFLHIRPPVSDEQAAKEHMEELERMAEAERLWLEEQREAEAAEAAAMARAGSPSSAKRAGSSRAGSPTDAKRRGSSRAESPADVNREGSGNGSSLGTAVEDSGSR